MLLGLVIWAFSLSIVSIARSSFQDLHDASIGVVDEDNSPLSRRITGAFLLPYFKPPRPIAASEVNHLMNTGQLTFVLEIPPYFERDVLAGRNPAIQVRCRCHGDDAGRHRRRLRAADHRPGARRISSRGPDGTAATPVNLDVRIAFNPNLTTSWFTSVMGVINNVTMLAIILAGAAIVREREHGTMDHLLVMPLTPFEIAMSKIWSNALVITIAVGLSPGARRARLARRSDRRLDPAVPRRRRASTCSSPPRSASFSAPSRARCRSSACSTCWSPFR